MLQITVGTLVDINYCKDAGEVAKEEMTELKDDFISMKGNLRGIVVKNNFKWSVVLN